MLVTYDEIMAWYQHRKEAGLTIEPPSLLSQYQANPATDIPAIPLCDTCRWHIAGLWGSEYCGGRPNCYNCDSWMMYRADDYYNPDDNDSWKDWRRKEKF